MKLYIDFDGVIVDTWPVIVNKYYEKYLTFEIEEVKLRQLFNRLKWEDILEISVKNINNIKVLKKLENYNITILTKINTMDEKKAKENFLKKNNINLKIEFVDIDNKKTNIADVKNNILIDDEIKNLIDWKEHGGKGILYSKNKDNKDSDGIENIGFDVIFNLKYEECVDLLTR